MKKRLIFTVTTGRSGTMFLASILRLLKGNDCFHEPGNLFNQYFREAIYDQKMARRFWLDRKLPEISSLPHKVYIETSHLFCKGFFEPLLDLGHVPDLILLSRNKREVALSLLNLRTIPGRTPAGIESYLGPDDPGVLKLPDYQLLSDYQLCYWYCLEIQRRQYEYGSRITALGGRVVPLLFDDLINIQYALPYLQQSLQLQSLSLSGGVKFLYKTIRPQKLNDKKDQKSDQESVSLDFQKEEQELIKYLSEYNDLKFIDYL